MNSEQIQILLRALDAFEGSEDVSIETSGKCPEIEEQLLELLGEALANEAAEG